MALFGLSGHTYADDSPLYISMLASQLQTAAAQLAACIEIECLEDSANLDRNWATASQADRHSAPADKLSC